MPKCKTNDENKDSEPVWEVGSSNVFKDLGFEDAEAVNLLARTKLISKLRELIQERKLTQAEAARLLQVKQPRIAEIMNMHIDKFSVDLLLKYLDRLGHEVSFTFQKKGEVA
jgi:predicted XRE-type DNA-binding protein